MNAHRSGAAGAPHISTGIFNRMRVFENPHEPTSSATAGPDSLDDDAADAPLPPPQPAPPADSEESAPAAASGERSSSSDDCALENGRAAATAPKMMMSPPPPAPPGPPGGVQTDAEGLILPKKLVNPCLESTDRKELHRELKFNTKVGKSVLNQKTELQRAYERQKERQQQHSLEQQHSPTAAGLGLGLKGELSRVIMERAQKHEHARQQLDGSSGEDDDRQYVNPEYLNVRAKLRAGQRADAK